MIKSHFWPTTGTATLLSELHPDLEVYGSITLNPPVGGLDLSPIIVFVIIFFLQSFIANDVPRMLLR